MKIHGRPNEVADAIPFAADETHRAYDRAHANRFYEYPPSKNGASGIAHAGNQSQDRIEAKAQAGAGNTNPGIQPVREFGNGGKTR